MTYDYGVKNKYVPSLLAPNAYGWPKGVGYSSADVPSRWINDTSLNSPESLRQQFAYEWFQSGDRFAGFDGTAGMSNPPFVGGAAGRLHPLLADNANKPARILRGYIRRADYDVKDGLSKCRLYFMYNPETITRDYVSYLEQSALDPFNTVYQSGNLIAPPSILNFSFELFFDRQEENASDSNHPGVFVDYQFFDMVVRNVIPTDPNQTSNTIPDSGVMMVNPRDITVIFSPQITVQGRPTNASVTFEKFSHRMTPVRMRIQLTILASYFGPVRDMVEYKKEELPPEVSIPIDQIKKSVFSITFNDVQDDSTNKGTTGSTIDIPGQLGQANDANHKIRLQALAWAMANTKQGGPGSYGEMNAGWTNYATATTFNYMMERHNLPHAADCSGLVTEAYVTIGYGTVMGWNSYPGTGSMPGSLNKNNAVYVRLSSLNWQTDLLPGDILIHQAGGSHSTGHTGFFMGYSGNGCQIFDASSSRSTPEVGEHHISGVGSFTHLIRPTPLGVTSSAAQATNYNSTA